MFFQPHGNYIEILKPYYIEVDKWTYLIDGDVGTIFHTEYGTNSIKYPTDAEPYKFVVDTGKIQQFNYFTITTILPPWIYSLSGASIIFQEFLSVTDVERLMLSFLETMNLA